MPHQTSQPGYVEDCLALDIRELKRQGVIQSGESREHAISWRDARYSASRALLRADCRDIDGQCTLHIDAIVEGVPVEQLIDLIFLPTSIAGHRAYFLCPFSAHRCELLYLQNGMFASRQAHGLSYLSQSLTDLSRARRRIAKLRSRLEGNGLLPRPRGKRRIKFAIKLMNAKKAERSIYLDKLRNRIG